MVGFEKINQQQSEFGKLKTISLRGMMVKEAGPDIDQYVGSLTLLDIGENCIESWDVMASMASAMPKLTTLNVDNNRMKLPTNPDAMTAAFGASLTVLYMCR